MGTEDELAALGGQLEGVAEQLADLALDQLRRASDPDDPERKAAEVLERRITRARRAVQKAASVLDAGNEAFPD